MKKKLYRVEGSSPYLSYPGRLSQLKLLVVRLFSKISLVLISASPTASHAIPVTDYALVYRGSRLCCSRAWVLRQ